MTWTPYVLDNIAQHIVLKAIERDLKNKTKSVGQAHRLRGSCAYGLERFWGEQIRLMNEKNSNDKAKGEFTQDVWKAFASIMKSTGINLPDQPISMVPKGKNLEQSIYIGEIQKACDHIRSLDEYETQASLAVLTSLCDAIVWWKQRLAKEDSAND